MGNFLSVGVPSVITSALGTAGEQRKRADDLAAQEALNRYRAENLGLDRLKLAETTRQHDLQYGPAEIDVPGLGKVSGPRWAIPAMIQAASAREKDVGPEELAALGTIRERMVSPAAERTATAEAGAEGAVLRRMEGREQETGGVTGARFREIVGPPPTALTVGLPQGLRLPRTSVEKLFTEAGAQRKEVDLAAQKEKQGKANARYRQLYSTAISQQIPHALADATAIAQATQEFGIAPEREAFVGAPTEREAKITTGSFTNEAGDKIIYGLDDTGGVKFQRNLGRVHEQQQFNLGLYRTNLVKRSRNLPVTDQEIAAMTPQEAGGVLADLNRTDPLTQRINEIVGGAINPTATPTGPAAPSGGESLPPAAANRGRSIRDNATGQVYRSDGTRWVPVQ